MLSMSLAVLCFALVDGVPASAKEIQTALARLEAHLSGFHTLEVSYDSHQEPVPGRVLAVTKRKQAVSDGEKSVRGSKEQASLPLQAHDSSDSWLRKGEKILVTDLKPGTNDPTFKQLFDGRTKYEWSFDRESGQLKSVLIIEAPEKRSILSGDVLALVMGTMAG